MNCSFPPKPFRVAPAVVNAIQDAIGIEFYEIPVTPEKVLAALAAKK